MPSVDDEVINYISFSVIFSLDACDLHDLTIDRALLWSIAESPIS
jgi:hypothetical protein